MPSGRIRRGWIVAALACCWIAVPVVFASAATPKRVLVVHSFGNAAPPFTTHSAAFEKELTEKMGEPVDLDEVSLDVARYATLDIEEALVDLMRARQTKWQPDLVVPVGSPAGIFVAQHRDRLFPAKTPIIYTGMDQRRLPPGALERNASFVGESFDLPALVEDILQVAPKTKHIAVVIGASPLEQYWAEAFRKEFQPYENRVSFSWLNDLSLPGILERARNLPPDSYILLVLMMRDASGVTHNADEVLQQIHAVANAPINGMYQHQLGLGIVGGRLYQGEAEGIEAAHMAIRILRGESASNFPPVIIGPLPPRYDWRELQKWGIDENSLPPGSTVMFRMPTIWQEYRKWIIGAVSVCAVQALLISALAANLLRRRRAERSLMKKDQALHESEDRVALAAEAARLGVWELNTTTRQLWLSAKARELFQLGDDADVTYAALQARVHPEDRVMRESAIARTIRENGAYEVEYRVVLGEGTVRWFSGRGRCVADAEGGMTRLLGVSMDVTERKEAQELLRLTTEAASTGILLADNCGCIVMVNAHIEELFGYPRSELIGMPVEQLLPERFATRVAAFRGEFLAAPQAAVIGSGGELSGRSKSGAEFPIEVSVNPVQMPRGTMMLATVVDITPRKRAEEEARRQREQIELLGRVSLLGEMTASLAHELGQPLSAIVSNASAGTRFIDGGNVEPGNLREIFADIGIAGRRARDIILNVRNGIKTGQGMCGPLAINTVVQSVALMVRPDAAAHSCGLKMSLAEDLPLIEADALQIQQVLINLVGNAFHAMLETPVALRMVEIATEHIGHETVRVTVRDHGAGILDGALGRLFEQFYTTKTDGLGMGLAIVRSIVEAHHGTITARNAEGGGACFQFELPARSDGRV